MATDGGGVAAAVAGGPGVAGGVESFFAALPVRDWASFAAPVCEAQKQLSASIVKTSAER
jgi:hypothetical protein